VVCFPNFMAEAGNPLVELYELVIQPASLFGRLIYIANLWNPQTSRYDRGLPERFRSPETDQALVKWHYTFFIEWLSLPLPEKERDVALYRMGNPGPGKTIRELGEAAIPPLVRAEERRFFIQDLTFIQAML
jgi:hypothetical protein